MQPLPTDPICASFLHDLNGRSGSVVVRFLADRGQPSPYSVGESSSYGVGKPSPYGIVLTGGRTGGQPCALQRCVCQSGLRTPGWGTPEREGVYRLTHCVVDGTTDVRFHTARPHERLTVRHP